MAANGTVVNGTAANHVASSGEALPQDPTQSFDTILVLDFGSQFTHLLTRRLRSLNVYSEMLPCTQKIQELSFKPKGIILSGSPYSVYAADAPQLDPAIFDLNIPILGICYGMQCLCWHFENGVVVGSEKKEYGHAMLQTEGDMISKLFKDLPSEMPVWMSHGDRVSRLPQGFATIATTANSPFAGIAHQTLPLLGIQFHPEVTHTPKGTQIIKNFAVGICGARQTWTMDRYIEKEISRIRELVGQGSALGAVSGGVDSSVAAKLMQRAIGDRFRECFHSSKEGDGG